jgi:phage tail sheath gpL-like
MPSAFPLVGIDPSDPVPGIRREIKFAQGDNSGSAPSLNVVIFGNKTSAGSETADTLGVPIVGLQDCIDRFGARSEVTLEYRCFTAIDKDAEISAVAILENVSGTASSCTVTFVGTASGAGTVKITVIGETVEVGVESGDIVDTIASALAVKINSQPHWPLTASAASGVVTVTSANVGPRSAHHLNQLRATITSGITTTCTKSAVTAGTGADDNTLALAAIDTSEFGLHIGPYSTTSSTTATDNGMGEHSTKITTDFLPATGKAQMLFCGHTGTQATATTVATSLNSVRAFLWHAEDNDWSPAMIAAHCAAAVRSKRIGDAGANMVDYGKGATDVFSIPDPFDKTDRPTKTEVRADLNNGVCSINFTNSGRAFIVRDVTTYSVNGSSKDYRARSGHIPFCADRFWSDLGGRYAAQRQPKTADEPGEGQKPLQGFTYPSAVKKMAAQALEDACSGSAVYLDPGALDTMKASIECVGTNDGISLRVKPRAVKHNNKAGFLIEESSPAT